MAAKKEEPKKEKKAEEKPAHEHAEKKAKKEGHKAAEKPAHAHAEKREKKAAEKKPEVPSAPGAPPAPAAHAAPAGKKEKKPKRKKSRVALARGKRKEAIARAVVSPGKGRFVFNRIPFDAIPNRYIREIVKEPLNFLGAELSGMDINVYVRGGGQMGQAQAARTAVAKALVGYTQDEKLKNAYLEHDRSLLVEDVRRVEPKKYKGPKARARFQKSYR